MRLRTTGIIALCMFCLLQFSCSDIIEETITHNAVPTTRSLSKADYYYYYHGQKTPLTSIPGVVYVSTKDSSELSVLAQKIAATSSANDIIIKKGESCYWTIIKHHDAQQNLKQYDAISLLRTTYDNIHVAPVFGEESKPVSTSEYFYIKVFENSEAEIHLKEFSNEHNVEVVKPVDYMPGWYVLKSPSTSDGLSMSNLYYESGNFEDVDPAFMFDFKTDAYTNEPLESSQWSLASLNMGNAWNISKGSSDVIVAVLDQGVDASHQEFSTNYSSMSYDITNGSSPSVVRGNHGTHVGGIIGANHNNIQIAGIAPQTTLLSISHPLLISQTASSELATGIGYARTHGASVINNSWGDQGGTLYPAMHSSILENAINTALTSGRNGKGMVVVFAAGNYNSSQVDYPAYTNDQILVVGSIDNTHQRSSFSSYGSYLDVVAPGGHILSTIPGNQTSYMNGTSMAAPHATALAALILSINPNLTGKQVVNIIEKSARKLPSYAYTFVSDRQNGTWNNQTGYGEIDAYAALQMAQASVNFSNQTVNSDQTVNGWDITSNNITVSNNANLVINVGNCITITPTWTVDLGSTLSIY